MRTNQSLSSLTASLLTQLENYFQKHRPDVVLGHGDTSSCFATALSCFYHKIPFLHVEAGLRTHCLETPFPEEFNRQNIASLAQHHFAPTEIEKQNLLNEGINASAISIIGSTVHDAIEIIREKFNTEEKPFPFELPTGKKIVTVTLHRREKLNSLEQTLSAIRNVALKREDAFFICPIHPNPLVQSAFKECLSDLKNVRLLDPLSYPAFIRLLLKSQLILTDSGGIQEEASFLGKRILIARSETERQDGINEGLVSVIGTSSEQIFFNLNEGLNQQQEIIPLRRTKKYATNIIADYIEKAVL